MKNDASRGRGTGHSNPFYFNHALFRTKLQCRCSSGEHLSLTLTNGVTSFAQGREIPVLALNLLLPFQDIL
jgi:hypothetical protein